MLNASETEREEVLRTHFKFMILRDPTERMLSAYKDKVASTLLVLFICMLICYICYV